MNHKKNTIHIVKHLQTGAKVPVIIKKINKNNLIEDYEEYTENRKGFNLEMLQNRWDKCREDVIEFLQQFKVPAFVRHQDVLKIKSNTPLDICSSQPIDVAIFWEEYIYGIERKTKIPHKKLKSRSFFNELIN